jgi:23S rRNA (adenine2503-C2)-methyltransferase
LDGVQRNLSTGQIVEQVLRVTAEARAAGGRLSNVVFMGLGEPLANYDNVLRAVRTINASWGPNIGARKITISTVGLPKQIRRLADEGMQLNLALSLHAPNDALRAELIPWAERISIAQLTDACRYYFERTGREITLEYVLLGGVNDRPAHAAQLARFTKSLRCNVNLIRYNPVAGLPFERPSGEAASAFQRYLREHGVNAHIRTSRGLDIEAACGQLRRKQMQTAHAAVSLGMN